MYRPLTAAISVLAGALALSPAASAADVTVVADTSAQGLTALGGTMVWVTGSFGSQSLMRLTSAGPAPVVGAPKARAYRSVDLGRDVHGRLVLTYLRCTSGSSCVAYRDDLQGHRTRIMRRPPAGCSLTTAPAQWRERIVFGLRCRGSHPAARTGLFVRRGLDRLWRLPLPKEAVRFNSDTISEVDLRGTRVGAVAADIYEYVFTETTGGSGQRSFLAAASEGDSDEHVKGVTVGPGGAVWSLVDAEHVGDPNVALLRRLTTCLRTERLTNPPGPDEESGYLATDLAVDGSQLYLVAPQAGVVSHAFAPEPGCAGV